MSPNMPNTIYLFILIKEFINGSFLSCSFELLIVKIQLSFVFGQKRNNGAHDKIIAKPRRGTMTIIPKIFIPFPPYRGQNSSKSNI